MKKSVPAAERKRDYHAGPGDSFPIGPAGQHLQAAWDLAGHAANPDEVRRHIIAFAHEHGLMDHLPQSAKDWHAGTMAKKATSSAVSQLFHLAWHHESMEGDRDQQRRLAQFASDNGLTHLLPDEAHSVMHEHGIPHNHEGVQNDENGMHRHPIMKAYNPISKQGLIVKSWESGDSVFVEGWLSTPTLDLEKDVTEPESFSEAIDGYFARRAPLSIEHGTKTLPIGHLQKAAIVRDGKTIKAAVHPTDPADFEHFPGSGSGVWIRAVANEEPGMSAIRKGNVGGFSFIANGREFERIPGGRYRYTKLDPWLESTIAAYPVNPDAIIAVAKAYGLKEEEPPTMELEELLRLAAEKINAEKAPEPVAVKGITKEELADLFGQFEQKIEAVIDEKVQKAMPVRGEGVGRKGTVETPADPRESDPAAYIVQKAMKGEDLDQTDKELVWGMTFKALTLGMTE